MTEPAGETAPEAPEAVDPIEEPVVEPVEEPAEDDLYRTGTATHIHKMFKLPDGSLRLIVQGLVRLRLDKVVAALQQGEGTAGQLLRNKELYENMNGTMAELRDLVAAIRKDPQRFLNVRVSLF